jgi:hypothetical protein
MLFFSGGKTQAEINASEAGSYFHAATLKNFLKSTRFVVETRATDSYQNLLFSVVRFQQLTGSYPTKITVITHAFKERRFLELHAPAIKYPLGALRLSGINPPMTLAELEDVQHGEMLRGYSMFSEDLYGVRNPLHSKRIARGWSPERTKVIGEGLTSEAKRLLDWTGGESGNEIFPEKLPWEHC